MCRPIRQVSRADAHHLARWSMANRAGEDATTEAILKRSRISIINAGGVNARFALMAYYSPRTGQTKRVKSNDLRYGKTWATKTEISKADMVDFLNWIQNDRARGGQGANRGRAGHLPTTTPRTSSRVAQLVQARTPIHTSSGARFEVEQAVVQCVKYLIDKVAYRARYWGDSGVPKVNQVQSKRRRRKTDVKAPARYHFTLPGRRMTRPRLTQRRARGYRYRTSVLIRQGAAKAEDDVNWLLVHELRLATKIARQELHELLPEGASL